MRECRRHPLESQPSGGVCARCLEERLLWLWRGESFREDDSERVLADQLPGSSQIPDAGSSREPASSSLASVRKQLQVHGVARPPATAGVSSDVERDGGGSASSRDGDSTLQNSKDVMEEWAEFHARRRRSLELGHEGELESPKVKSKSFDAIEPVETTDTENVRRAPNPDLVILMNAQKMRSRSMPLDNRSAEDTALRVINEQADDLFFDELDAYCIAAEDRDGGGEALQESMAAQRCFSPVWQRTSPKWVKVLVSPMTSRNRVFPSRSKEDARKGRGSRKRGARFASSDWNGKESHGGSSPQWTGPSQAQDRSPAHPRSSTRGSVFSWLQDADATYQRKYEQREQLTSSSSSSLTTSVSTDSWLRDLTTVGHLHEIAEELEIVEESSEEEEDGLGDISSFGKFLLLAAQRQPEARLTRLESADSH